MTTEDVSVVAAAMAAYSEQRWNDLPGKFAPNAVSQVGPNAETVGQLQLMETIGYYAQYFQVRFEPETFLQDGATVALRARMPEAHGQLIDVPLAGFVDVEHGLITKMQLIFNYEDWLKAAA